MIAGNLLTDLPSRLAEEEIVTLLQAPNVRIERIVSTGQATAPGQWYDQDRPEWVLVVSGTAAIAFEGEDGPLQLTAGSFVHIGAHVRHRVAWTDRSQPTVWLAVHYDPAPAGEAAPAVD